MLQEIQHEHIYTNGVRYHYAAVGEGPLVVLLHGFPEFWYAWRHQLPVLGLNFRAVAPDLRGCSHWVNEEQPELTNRLLLEFFQER